MVQARRKSCHHLLFNVSLGTNKQGRFYLPCAASIWESDSTAQPRHSLRGLTGRKPDSPSRIFGRKTNHSCLSSPLLRSTRASPRPETFSLLLAQASTALSLSCLTDIFPSLSFRFINQTHWVCPLLILQSHEDRASDEDEKMAFFFPPLSAY